MPGLFDSPVIPRAQGIPIGSVRPIQPTMDPRELAAQKIFGPRIQQLQAQPATTPRGVGMPLRPLPAPVASTAPPAVPQQPAQVAANRAATMSMTAQAAQRAQAARQAMEPRARPTRPTWMR